MESRVAAAPFLCGKKQPVKLLVQTCILCDKKQPGRGRSVDCMLCRVKKHSGRKKLDR